MTTEGCIKVIRKEAFGSNSEALRQAADHVSTMDRDINQLNEMLEAEIDRNHQLRRMLTENLEAVDCG